VAGDLQKARENLAEAIRTGSVSDRTLRSAARKFLKTEEHRGAAFLYLRILCYRGALKPRDVPDVEITDRYLRDCIALASLTRAALLDEREPLLERRQAFVQPRDFVLDHESQPLSDG